LLHQCGCRYSFTVLLGVGGMASEPVREALYRSYRATLSRGASRLPATHRARATFVG
jgi:hypothetical protein